MSKIKAHFILFTGFTLERNEAVAAAVELAPPVFKFQTGELKEEPERKRFVEQFSLHFR